jgi:predicted NAD/FAD-dependent oxidoreductase
MTDNIVFQFDFAIVGAGIAGLTCAKHLQNSGLKVIILDKSPGVGGRIATRRLENTWVDHGLPFLEDQGPHTQKLIGELRQEKLIQPWTEQIYQFQFPTFVTPASVYTRYIAPQGMTAIAKYLAQDLTIGRNCRVTQLKITDQLWQLRGNYPDQITAKGIVLAIPAPQAAMLLENSQMANFPQDFVNTLKTVQFHPCLVVMAGYSAQYNQEVRELFWRGSKILEDAELAWVALDSSKREKPPQPVFMLHSTPSFAQNYLDSPNLDQAIYKLLNRASYLLLPWLNQPLWVQAHCWRYAIACHPLPSPYLSLTHPLPLICCGDWCGGNRLESALNSAIAAAEQIQKIVRG